MAQTRKNSIPPLILVLVCAAVMLQRLYGAGDRRGVRFVPRLPPGQRRPALYDMWEPHQLSSLPAAALLAMFIGITGGTTGVLVFFRLVVLACKAGMSYAFTGVRRDLGKPAALLAALVLFALCPSGSSARTTPASSSTGRWRRSSPAPLCHPRLQQLWLVPLGAVCACLRYLAFPQSAAAFAVLWIGMLILGKRYGEPKHRGAWVLLGSCAVCGVVFLGMRRRGVQHLAAAQPPDVDFCTTRSIHSPPPSAWPCWPARH